MLGTAISDIHHERFIMKDFSIIFIAIENIDTESELERFDCDHCVYFIPNLIRLLLSEDEIGKQIFFLED